MMLLSYTKSAATLLKRHADLGRESLGTLSRAQSKYVLVDIIILPCSRDFDF